MAVKSTKGRAPTVSKSVRCAPETWERAKMRAESEGLVINDVVKELLEGYGNRQIDMPRVTKVYAGA